jgi:hypothetical protein
MLTQLRDLKDLELNQCAPLVKALPPPLTPSSISEPAAAILLAHACIDAVVCYRHSILLHACMPLQLANNCASRYL